MESAPIPTSLGWTSTYNVYLREADWRGDLILRAGDGQQIMFAKQADGSFEGGPGVRDSLTRNGDGSYTVTRHDQVNYQLDSNGNVTAIKDRNNQGLTFSYTSGRMTSISGNDSTWSVRSAIRTDASMSGPSTFPRGGLRL